MEPAISKLNQLLIQGETWFSTCRAESWFEKPAPEKWSKQEILGHLIDSAVNNLKRFTDCPFSPEPYRVVEYRQDECVVSGQYQVATKSDIVTLWLALNRRIGQVMAIHSEKNLDCAVVLSNGTRTDLRWLMTDYVEHLEHHLKQIMT